MGGVPRRRLLVGTGIVLLVGSIGLTGCQSQASSDSSASSGSADNTGSIASVELSAELDHIHGAAVDFADGTVLAATHSGVWRISPGGTTARVGAADDDFMGFTVPRADRWLASGHPGPASSFPDPLGLLESTDQGRSWAPLSRTGQTDFHALAAKGNVVVGFDGRGLIRSEDSGQTWTDAAAIQVASLAYAGDRLLAITANGLEASTDNGASFRPVEGSPAAALMSATGMIVWAVDRGGKAWLSTDAGATWQPRTMVGGQVSGLAAKDSTRAYAITTTNLITIS